MLLQHSVCEVRAFFQLPSRALDLRAVAMETVQGVANISQAGLIHAIQTHKVKLFARMFSHLSFETWLEEYGNCTGMANIIK